MKWEWCSSLQGFCNSLLSLGNAAQHLWCPTPAGQSLTGEGPECRMILNRAEDGSVLECQKYGTKDTAKEAMSWVQLTVTYPSAGRYFTAGYPRCWVRVCGERKQQGLGEVADVSTLTRLGRKEKVTVIQVKSDAWIPVQLPLHHKWFCVLCHSIEGRSGSPHWAGRWGCVRSLGHAGGETPDMERQWKAPPDFVPTHSSGTILSPEWLFVKLSCLTQSRVLWKLHFLHVLLHALLRVWNKKQFILSSNLYLRVTEY